MDVPQNEMRIGQRQWSTRAVARGTRNRARALRTNAFGLAVPPQNRSTTRSHTFNSHARGRDCCRSNFCFIAHFRRAINARHVGACAAHVKRDAMREAAFARNVSRTGHAARGS